MLIPILPRKIPKALDWELEGEGTLFLAISTWGGVSLTLCWDVEEERSGPWFKYHRLSLFLPTVSKL